MDFDEVIIKNLDNTGQLKEFNRIHYGREDHCAIELKTLTNESLDVKAFSFSAAKEESRAPRLVKLGLIQHSIVLPTDKSIEEQRQAIFEKVQTTIEKAALENVNILCLQETWSMPFFLCTKERERWSDFAESATDGPSVTFLSKLAKKHGIVIVSPILEDDNGVWWNTAVVIDEAGLVLGKHRKNHLPRVGSFNETNYYCPGNLGHPVFETTYGKIAVNICFGRHHALNWLMFGLNGAEIVFNPSATVSSFGESFWGIEARNAAIANSYFTCSINRVGTEEFFVDKDGETKNISRSYYGSSYVTAPDGCRTPNLSRYKDGLLITKVDLNLCRQVQDRWGFIMTGRLDLYVKELNDKVDST